MNTHDIKNYAITLHVREDERWEYNIADCTGRWIASGWGPDIRVVAGNAEDTLCNHVWDSRSIQRQYNTLGEDPLAEEIKQAVLSQNFEKAAELLELAQLRSDEEM